MTSTKYTRYPKLSWITTIDAGDTMTKLGKFAVDFYLAGTVIAKAKDREEAIRKAGSVDIGTLMNSVEKSGFGKDYMDEV